MISALISIPVAAMAEGLECLQLIQGTTGASKMDIPPAFRNMAGLMHQDVFLDLETEWDVLAYLAAIPQGDDRDVVLSFIDRLLASDLSDRELSDLWGRAGADWYFFDDGARLFFEWLRDEIAGRRDG